MTLAGKGQQILLQKSCKGKQQALTERTGMLLLLLLFVKKYKQHAPQKSQIVIFHISVYVQIKRKGRNVEVLLAVCFDFGQRQTY